MTPSTPALVDSAVLVPVYRNISGQLMLVLIRRSAHGLHGGQIAFPGGKRDPGDATLLETALREAHEEIGLAREATQFLDELPVIETYGTGFRIAPFLARVRPIAHWTLQQGEVEEVIEVAVDDLKQPGSHGERDMDIPGRDKPVRLPFYRLGPYELWGATYRIVRPLISRLEAGEWAL